MWVCVSFCVYLNALVTLCQAKGKESKELCRILLLPHAFSRLSIYFLYVANHFSHSFFLCLTQHVHNFLKVKALQFFRFLYATKFNDYPIFLFVLSCCINLLKCLRCHLAVLFYAFCFSCHIHQFFAVQVAILMHMYVCSIYFCSTVSIGSSFIQYCRHFTYPKETRNFFVNFYFVSSSTKRSENERKLNFKRILFFAISFWFSMALDWKSQIDQQLKKKNSQNEREKLIIRCAKVLVCKNLKMTFSLQRKLKTFTCSLVSDKYLQTLLSVWPKSFFCIFFLSVSTKSGKKCRIVRDFWLVYSMFCRTFV